MNSPYHICTGRDGGKTTEAYLELKRDARSASCFMVGDQLDRDIKAAAAGFSTFYFPGGFAPYWVAGIDTSGTRRIARFDAIVPECGGLNVRFDWRADLSGLSAWTRRMGGEVARSEKSTDEVFRQALVTATEKCYAIGNDSGRLWISAFAKPGCAGSSTTPGCFGNATATILLRGSRREWPC
jgi:hypothetical protein